MEFWIKNWKHSEIVKLPHLKSSVNSSMNNEINSFCLFFSLLLWISNETPMHVEISPLTLDSALLQADMAKYCKWLMKFTFCYHQLIQLDFPQHPPKELLCHLKSRDCVFWKTAEKDSPWTSIQDIVGCYKSKPRNKILRQGLPLWLSG